MTLLQSQICQPELGATEQRKTTADSSSSLARSLRDSLGMTRNEWWDKPAAKITSAHSLDVGVVVEVGGDPAFDFAKVHALAAVIIVDLVATDFADSEVF